jgi:hypothetical protein
VPALGEAWDERFSACRPAASLLVAVEELVEAACVQRNAAVRLEDPSCNSTRADS